MLLLHTPNVKLPLMTLSVADTQPQDSTIATVFGGAVSAIANEVVAESLYNPLVKSVFTSGPLTLNTGSVPFFPDCKIVAVKSKSGLAQGSVKVALGNRPPRTVQVESATSAVVLETSLSMYLGAVIKIRHLEEVAKKNGRGLTTKELFQIGQAKSRRDSIGAMKHVWHSTSQTPIVLNSSGLTVRVTDTYSAWAPLVLVGDQTSSGLGSVIASQKADMVAYYLRLFPGATTVMVDDAMRDSGIEEWYYPSFMTYTIPLSVSTTVQKPPLLRNMESYPVTELLSLANAYFGRVVARKVSADGYKTLVGEFSAALQWKGAAAGKSDILAAHRLFEDVCKKSLGYENPDVDIPSALSESYGWIDYAEKTPSAPALHPLHWINPQWDGVTLSGEGPGDVTYSHVMPTRFANFASMVAEAPSTLRAVLNGWEHFIASVYSASFAQSRYETDSAYRIKSFRPMFGSVGLQGVMMHADIIGVLE